MRCAFMLVPFSGGRDHPGTRSSVPKLIAVEGAISGPACLVAWLPQAARRNRPQPDSDTNVLKRAPAEPASPVNNCVSWSAASIICTPGGPGQDPPARLMQSRSSALRRHRDLPWLFTCRWDRPAYWHWQSDQL